MKSTRINTGIYEISINGRTFEIENMNGEWQLVEMKKYGQREYCNHFNTKKEAMIAIEWIVNNS